jgi:hypothetical protein
MTTVETVKRLNLLQTHKFKIVPEYPRADKTLLVPEIIIKQSEETVSVVHNNKGLIYEIVLKSGLGTTMINIRF